MQHFPEKSGQSAALAAAPRLTGRLPDVGTAMVFHRNLIRDVRNGLPLVPGCLQGAVIAYQSNVRN
jgi:hypothetical protein